MAGIKDLRGKTVLLTGASRGLGVYIATALAREGANLVLSARTADALEETRRACEAMGARAVAVPADMSSPDEQRRLLAATEREFGRVDILINNAGIEYTEALQNLSTEQIDALLTLNLHAPIWFTKAVLPAMLARRGGVVVNVASLAGHVPSPYMQIYGASKAGLISFTLSMVAELRGAGVHMSVVCPTFVDDAGMWAQHQAAGVKTPPLGKPVSPEKVAHAVLDAIRGKTHIIVAAGPQRPLLAVGALFSGFMPMLVHRIGLDRIVKAEADRLRQGQDRADARAREDAGIR